MTLQENASKRAWALVEQRGSEDGIPISLADRPLCDPSIPGGPSVLTMNCAQLQRESIFDITFTVGVGLMLYATDFFGISFEWRALPFAWNTSGSSRAPPLTSRRKDGPR